MITLIDRIAIAATRLTLSPKSEQHQFFSNNIRTLLQQVMAILITKENTL